MRQLRLVGLAEDGASMVLETPTGESFRLPIDERVRAACRGDLIRLGQIELEMDNPLRPREIQARVRAGESAEQVAASAGMPLDRVLRFAYPMLQERERVVAQARTTKLRPKGSETLAELVEERLVGRGTDPATLRWDSWRREDGRWTVRLSWRHAAEHAANWTFDLARRTLQPDDPAAEQLSAEEFHARTITAVTPLAAAARVSGRPAPGSAGGGAAAGGSGGRPGGGGSTRADRVPGHPAGSARPGTGSAERDRPPQDSAGTAGSRPPGGAASRAGAGRDRPGRAGDAGRTGGASGTGAGGTGRGGDTGASRAAGDPGRAGAGGRTAGAGTPRGAEADPPADTGAAAEADAPRRVAAGGETDPPAEADDERTRRPSVPSWDDILLGVRRRH